VTSRSRSLAAPLARDHHVSLRRQLAAGLEAAIRDGHLAPGARLPSSRDMAVRLGVHRSTVVAAYARLRRAGWVSGGPGGRMRVGSPEAGGSRPRGTCVVLERDRTASPARALAAEGLRALLGEARRDGIPRALALSALGDVLGELAAPSDHAGIRLLLAEPRPGLRAALAAELSRRLGVVVETASHPDRFAPLGLGGPVLVRAGLEPRLGAAGREIVPLHLAGGTRERGIVRRSVRCGLVTLVSGSRAVREYAIDLAAREFARGISFAAIAPADAPSVIRAVAASRLVLFDEASRGRLPPTAVPAVPIRLLGDPWVASIGRYLGLPERRHQT